MNADLLVPSKFMVSREFGTGNIPREPLVTIDSVGMEKQDKEDWGMLSFREPWAKKLKVNATLKKCLKVMFGSDTDRWIGKRILLYGKPGYYFGEEGTAVRIKGSPDISIPITVEMKKFGSRDKDKYEIKPTGPQAAPRDQPASASTPWWDKLKKVAAEKSITDDRLKAITKRVMKRDKLSPSEITEADFAEVCAAIVKEATPLEPGSDL